MIAFWKSESMFKNIIIFKILSENKMADYEILKIVNPALLCCWKSD